MHHKPFISINRVATLLGIHHRTARRMLESLDLTKIAIGRRQLYRTREVAQLLRHALDQGVTSASMAPQGAGYLSDRVLPCTP